MFVVVFIGTILISMAAAKEHAAHGDKVREKLNELGLVDFTSAYVSKNSDVSFAIDSVAQKFILSIKAYTLTHMTLIKFYSAKSILMDSQ